MSKLFETSSVEFVLIIKAIIFLIFNFKKN